MISPYISALSANSRFLDGKDLGFSDTRMPLWEKSHDIRSEDEIPEEAVKAGKINSYFEDIEGYLERVKKEPFILKDTDHALDIGIGTYWKDARIKFVEDEESQDILVESRVMSTQPTVKEEVAMHAFYIGRVAYAQSEELNEGESEELLGIDKVNRNRYAAMHNGLDTKLYSPEGELMQAEEVLSKEIEKAKEGLDVEGIEYRDEYFEILENRLTNGTPSDKMAEGFNQVSPESYDSEQKYRKEALKTGLMNQGATL